MFFLNSFSLGDNMNDSLPTFDRFVLELILAHLSNCKKNGLTLSDMPPHLIILKYEKGNKGTIIAHDKMQFIEEKRLFLWHQHCMGLMSNVKNSMGYINFFVCKYEDNEYIGIHYNLKEYDLDLDLSDQCMIIPLMEDDTLDTKIGFVDPIELGLVTQENVVIH